jgi:hypothetical protein
VHLPAPSSPSTTISRPTVADAIGCHPTSRQLIGQIRQPHYLLPISGQQGMIAVWVRRTTKTVAERTQSAIMVSEVVPRSFQDRIGRPGIRSRRHYPRMIPPAPGCSACAGVPELDSRAVRRTVDSPSVEFGNPTTRATEHAMTSDNTSQCAAVVLGTRRREPFNRLAGDLCDRLGTVRIPRPVGRAGDVSRSGARGRGQADPCCRRTQRSSKHPSPVFRTL